MDVAYLFSFDGNLVDDEWYPCDTTLGDVIRIMADHGVQPDSLSEPGETDYHYCATENGYASDLQQTFIEASEYGVSEELATWARKRWGDSATWWATLQEATFSGIAPLSDVLAMADALGLRNRGTESMGTLGGPANPCGLAPDIVLEGMEIQVLIESCRVTPMVESEAEWDDVARMFENPWEALQRMK